MVEITYPEHARQRGPAYWFRTSNIWAARRKMRSDKSVQWRRRFEAAYGPPVIDRVVSFDRLAEKPVSTGLRFAILGDTGEGDRSQYALLPLLRSLNLDFLIINGDIAYPAGELDDFDAGFFRPYADLRLPIWAVPGNHEYYSRGKGAEFYEIFCTRLHDHRWEAAGMPHVPQPATYWELQDPGGGAGSRLPATVIGIDTTMEGHLDRGGFWPFVREADDEQHAWLESRLRAADHDGRSVIVLFHIPALVRERHHGGNRMRTLHRMLLEHPSVQLVVTAHEHNYQRYLPETFERYAREAHKARGARDGDLHYVVSGGGGAYLSRTTFKRGKYPAERCLPTPEQWPTFAHRGRRIVDGMGVSKTFIGRIAGLFDKDLRADGDVGRYLSFLLVDCHPEATTVSPVFLDNVPALYGDGHPDGTIIDVTDPSIPLDERAVSDCLRHDAPIVLPRRS